MRFPNHESPMPVAQPCRLSAAALARSIDNGELTAEAVMRSCLDRIAEREPVVRAWAHLDHDAALAAARACDKSVTDGLLKGVPFGIKDIFDTADMPTGYGSPIYTGCRPGFTASAASLPRAYCGVVGFKPSYGLFPPAGMHPNTESLDTVGIMARCVEDIALFRAALMAIPYERPGMPERPPRLALCRTPHWDQALPDGRAVLEEAAARLRASGCEIVESELPPECDGVSEVQRRHSVFEASRVHAPELYRHKALSADLLER